MVVATGDRPHLLRRTLEAARNQQTPLLEILVVCVDAVAQGVATAVAGDDTRVRILVAGSVPEARRLGVRQARGSSLLVAAPGDIHLPGAVDEALDLAGGPVPVVLAMAGDVAGATDLSRQPALAEALRLGRVVWTEVPAAVLADPDPDGMAATAHGLRGGFRVTDRPAYADVRVAPPPPHSVRVDPLPGLADRIAADRAVLAALVDLPDARAHAAAGAVSGLRPFLEAAETADAATWTALASHAADLAQAAAGQLERVDVVPRALARLAASGRRDDVRALVVARRFAGSDFPTTVVDGVVRADLDVGLEPDDLVVGEHESALAAQARRLRLAGDRVGIEVLAGVLHVDQTQPPTVHAQLVDGDRVIPLGVEVEADPAVGLWLGRAHGETEHDHEHGLLVLTCAAEDLPPGSWRIELDWATNGLVRAAPVTEVDQHGSAARAVLPIAGRGLRLRVQGSEARLEVSSATEEPPPGDVAMVEVRASTVRITVRGDADEVWLAGPVGHVHGVAAHGGVWVVPLEHDPWGLGARPLPSGDYRLHLAHAGVGRAARLTPPVLDRVPEHLRSTHHRVRLERGAGDGLVVRLDPLLADDETGPRAQRRLQAAYLQVDDPLDERLVYFQSFTGQWANDHPVAIQQELFRRRPDLRVCWAVADASAAVPEGSEPVLFRSRAWYDVLARAGHLVTNIELERWYRRRPGQQLLQTFHGYPSKTMGLGLWRARGLLPSHLEQQLDHTSRTWNALVTPHPDMDRYYREEYAYDGRILALGYPRDDVLVGPDHQRIRSETRRRLGIAPGRRVVLYAPTWRDDLATNFRAAEAVHHLDVEQAAAMLGEDYVLLLRGHRFHAAGGSTGSRVVDVTTYPDVNDLILAADAAVLDYSSMRFDVALTGRPMVFLVPDLDDYGSRTRGFLWDFGETAPGPWVRTTAEVVAELRDLDALRERWAAPLATFNARYNPLNDGHAAERVVADFFADLPPVSEA